MKERVDLKEYSEITKIHHPSFSARWSGLVLNQHYPTLGANADAVTDCVVVKDLWRLSVRSRSETLILMKSTPLISI